MDRSTRNQCIQSKNLVSTKENSDMFEIKPFLELLHVNNDINVQVKLFSTLSAYIMTNEESRDIIITYNPLYDKICSLLTKCPPSRATVMFNFLSALLYAVDEDSTRSKSLIVYAKNMIRSSGCLATMCDLFTSCMMHQDVWRSLCRCLSETCRGVEANQSYCTHLVPMGIQRCSQRHTEVFSVLQSLLHNHPRNINLFLESNGISLFQREFLQHCDCLQLLSTLVQSSTEAVRLINDTDVAQHMRDFLRASGTDSQLGQWATIILYYIAETKDAPEVVPEENQTVANNPIDETINKFTAGCDNLQCSTDTIGLLQNVMTEIMHCGTQSDFKYLQRLFPAQQLNKHNDHKNTKQFFIQNDQQNNEVITSQQNSNTKNNIPPYHQDHVFTYQCLTQSYPTKTKTNTFKQNITLKNITPPCPQQNDLAQKSLHQNSQQNAGISVSKENNTLQNIVPPSHLDHFQQIRNESIQHGTSQNSTFSFLQNDNRKRNFNETTAYQSNKCLQNKFHSNKTNSFRNIDVSDSLGTTSFVRQKVPEMRDFKPKFVSTPKKRNMIDENKFRREISSNITRRSIQYSIARQNIKRRVEKKKTQRRIQQSKIDKENKHRSISGWFFETINESCTTLVKTVKNIFKPTGSEETKETQTEHKSMSSISSNKSCSFSFTNYMRKRDAILKNECTKKSRIGLDDFSMESSSCHTCNDTVALKRKLANDEYLKQAVRKLKLGINLYGCDFKKISKQMWPQQAYMTPVVLYNLYRKLIRKK